MKQETKHNIVKTLLDRASDFAYLYNYDQMKQMYGRGFDDCNEKNEHDYIKALNLYTPIAVKESPDQSLRDVLDNAIDNIEKARGKEDHSETFNFIISDALGELSRAKSLLAANQKQQL